MRIILIISILLLNAVSYGKDSGKKSYRKTQEVNFDATDIDGQVRSPDGSYLSQKKGIKFLPIYEIEKQFDQEIKNSVEYLK